MATRKWRMREHFRGPVIFGSAGSPIDSTWYGDTASAVMKFDASEDELYFDGTDLWLKDDDQLEFGDVSDIVVDWDNTNSQLLFLPAAAGSTMHYGSSTYHLDVDWDVRNVDIDLYGTNPEIDINRNLTSGATDAAVVAIKQDNTSDDQVALKIEQDAAVAALDVNGAVDVDILDTYSTGVGLTVTRNLTSGDTDDVLVLFEQTNASDDAVALKVTQAATGYAGVDFDCGVDIDSTYTSAALNVVRNLTSGATGDVVVYLKQDNSGDDQAVLQVVQDATATAAVDIDGAVDIDSTHTGTALDVVRNLTSGVTSTAVVRIVQDNSGDDQAALEITQDATTALALDANGWCDIGYDTANPSGNVTTGAVRVVYNNSKWWLAVSHDGAGTFKYVEIAATSTA